MGTSLGGPAVARSGMMTRLPIGYVWAPVRID
jgi:hypothetical protein